MDQDYDLACNIYSPDGRIFQVEYASKAIQNSSTLLGLKCKDGVIIVAEKIIQSKLLIKESVKRVYIIGSHAGIGFTGYISDGRAAIQAGCSEVENYENYYGIKIPPHILGDRLAEFFHTFTQYGGYRPFGINLVIAAYDYEKKEPFLQVIDPLGSHFRFNGIACGKSKQAAKTEIEKLDLPNITCREALNAMAFIVHKVAEEQNDKPIELDAGWICEDTNWKFQLINKEICEEANNWGKEKLRRINEEDSIE